MTQALHNLQAEKETLFITLCAKALDYRRKRPVLNDQWAAEIVKRENINSAFYDRFGHHIVAVRARQLDDWTRSFIIRHPNATVVYFGCGLDARIKRINPGASVTWFDVDYPEVIEMRKKHFRDLPNYKMVAASVTDMSWIDAIPNDSPTLFIAEGLFEYLDVEDVKTVLERVTTYFRKGEMIFDVMNSAAVRHGKKRLEEIAGARHLWAVDKLEEVDRLNPKMQRISEMPVFVSPYMYRLSMGFRLLIRGFSIFPVFRNMIMLLRYRF